MVITEITVSPEKLPLGYRDSERRVGAATGK